LARHRDRETQTATAKGSCKDVARPEDAAKTAANTARCGKIQGRKRQREAAGTHGNVAALKDTN
jgi:hypothetical protein